MSVVEVIAAATLLHDAGCPPPAEQLATALEVAAPVECLQCGETRAWAKVPGRICGIESGYEYRELEHEWPRHRWADWTDKELAAFGVKPDAFERHRRTHENTFQWISCDDTVRGHHPATADCVPDFAIEIGQCITCGHRPEPLDSSKRTEDL